VQAGFRSELIGEFFGTDPEKYFRSRSSDFLPYIMEAKRWQSYLGCNPQEPKTELAQSVMQAVRHKLRRQDVNFEDLRLFYLGNGKQTWRFGVKGFIECDGCRAHLGFSMNEPAQIYEGSRADVIISAEQLRRDRQFIIAKRIVRILRDRMDEKSLREEKMERRRLSSFQFQGFQELVMA
jgi:hypothetical protein